MPYEEAFATALRVERARRNLTQAQVADAVGVTPAALCRYEQGKQKPNVQTLARLADFFGVSMDRLMGRT